MSTASDIAEAISIRLAGITVAGGYLTNIGQRSFRGRRKLDEAHIPCVVLVEGDDGISDSKKGMVKVDAKYIAEGHCVCDPDNPNDAAHDLVTDLKRCIFGGDQTFGGKVRDVSYLGRVINPREDGLAIVSASIEFTLTYAETLANP